MKLCLASLALLASASSTSAFAFHSSSRTLFTSTTTSTRNTSSSSSRLVLKSSVSEVPSDVESSSIESKLPSSIVTSARDEVIYTAKSLSEESLTGIFISSPKARAKLNKVVTELEAVSPGPFSERERELSIGDWELVCTARGPNPASAVGSSTGGNSSSSGGPPRLPFNLKPPSPGMIQDTIRKSVSVTQKIRTTTEGEEEQSNGNTINRVDHVIEYTPLTLKDVIAEDSPFKAVRDWNVNPLEVSKSKVTLVHDASVESLTPVFRTKIGLKSVIVTVAGTSQYLEPEGADILGINIPSIQDFLNAGTFDTTYVDENIRISRGTIGGVVNDLRVFLRKGLSIEDILEEGYESTTSTSTIVEEEEGPMVVDERLEKVSDAVKGVATAIEKLDKDVRTTVEKDVSEVGKAVEGVSKSITDAAKDVQEIVEEDLKEIGKSVEEFRSAVVEGVVKDGSSKKKEEVVDVENAVDVDVEQVKEEDEEETPKTDEDDVKFN